MKPLDPQPEPDWEPFHLPFDIGSGRSMFVETEAGPTIRMRFYRRRGDGALVGHVWFGAATFGPPGFVHGGVVSYVIDEAMGTAGWLAGYPVVAANLNIDYLEMTPLGQNCRIEATVDEIQRSKLILGATLSLDGRVLVRGSGVFPRMRRERMEALALRMGKEVPDLDGFDFVP
ncbi:MAG: PaaI family thioesterase [bacterium]|nr:PaaI family thioesterase [bacterium]